MHTRELCIHAYLVISLISILGIKAGCVSVDSCCTAEMRIQQTRVIVEVRQRHFTSPCFSAYNYTAVSVWMAPRKINSLHCYI